MIEYPVQVTEGLLQEITRRIVEGFDPDKVILFGSQASGRRRVPTVILTCSLSWTASFPPSSARWR